MAEEKKNEAVVTIDVAAVPKGMDMEKFLMIWQNFGTIFYDSTQGLQPTVLDGDAVQVAMIDTSSEEGKEKLNKILKEYENDNREASESKS